jgi:hypothetical protein
MKPLKSDIVINIQKDYEEMPSTFFSLQIGNGTNRRTKEAAKSAA